MFARFARRSRTGRSGGMPGTGPALPRSGMTTVDDGDVVPGAGDEVHRGDARGLRPRREHPSLPRRHDVRRRRRAGHRADEDDDQPARHGGQIVVDVVCTGRFYDFFEKRQERWAVVRRQPIYEKDRMDPVDPAARLTLDASLLAQFPEGLPPPRVPAVEKRVPGQAGSARSPRRRGREAICRRQGLARRIAKAGRTCLELVGVRP